MKPGYKTSEFWITAIANIVGASLAILAIRGLVSSEESALYIELLNAITPAVVPLVLAYINGKYIKSRESVKVAEATKQVEVIREVVE